jgi:hypothetical protein
MEQNPAGPGVSALDTLSPAAAKEYLFGLLSALKLAEKRAEELDAESGKWISRVELAKSRGRPDLAAEAEKEAGQIKAMRERLGAEIGELQFRIGETRRQMPLLAARERGVDPDLLEQELLMAAGYFPGDDEKARNDRMLRDMEKAAAADAALAELKAKTGNK